MKISAAPSRTRLLLAFAAIYLIWGSTYLAIRVAVETLPPFLMAGVRFGIAGAVLYAVLRLRGAKAPTSAQIRDHAIVGACLLLGGNAVVCWAELRVPSGLTTLILGGSPFIMVAMDWARPGGARPTLGLCLGMAIGISGLAFLLGPGAFSTGTRPPTLCVAAILCSSVSWWAGSLYAKHSKSGTPPLMGAAIQMVCGSLFMIATGVALGEGAHFHLAAATRQSWLAFSYLVVAGSLVAYPVFVWLLAHSTPARVSTYAYVNPIVAVFLGWAVLGEPVTPRILTAGAAIIGAVAIITTQKSKTAGP